MAVDVVEVLGVYNADGGWRGETAYVVGRMLGRVHCGLCDITHTPLGRKRAWDAVVRGSRVPVRVAHRNELSAAERDAVRGHDLPLVLRRDHHEGWRVLLDAKQLDALDGSVAAFERELAAGLGG